MCLTLVHLSDNAANTCVGYAELLTVWERKYTVHKITVSNTEAANISKELRQAARCCKQSQVEQNKDLTIRATNS